MEPLGHNYIRSKIRALIPCIFHLNESQNNVLIFDANDSQAKSSLIFQNGLTHLGVYISTMRQMVTIKPIHFNVIIKVTSQLFMWAPCPHIMKWT